MQYDLADGKYTIVYDDKNYIIQDVLRYKESWRDVTGDNLIHFLFWRILELEGKHE